MTRPQIKRTRRASADAVYHGMGGERVCEVTEWANGEGYDVRIGSSTSAADEQRFDIESADAAALVALLSGMLLGDYQEGVGDE